jgi:predicted ester cyclase
LPQDGDIGIGVFPEGEKILVGGLRFTDVATHRVGPAYLQMRERTRREIPNDSAMIQQLLEFGDRLSSMVSL